MGIVQADNILDAVRRHKGDIEAVLGPELKALVLEKGLPAVAEQLRSIEEVQLRKIETQLGIVSGVEFGQTSDVLRDKGCGSYEQDLLGPYRYICEETGKEIRSKFIAAFNTWLQVDAETCAKIRRITQGLHNASLLIDDIEDNSKLRRGRPCAHLVYGVAHTINCANHVYFLAVQDVLALNNKAALELFNAEMIELHRGQGLDIWWRDGSQQRAPSVEEYMMMVKKKTGGLFRLSLGLMSAHSSNPTDLVPLLDNVAVYFQVLDDLLNLSSEEYHANKSFAEDLTEGKFSFPIVWAVERDGENRLLSLLKQRTEDDAMKRYFIDYLDSLGALEHTRMVLKD